MIRYTCAVAAKIATAAVTTDAMAADSVATVSVIDNAITTAKIVDQYRSEEFSQLFHNISKISFFRIIL